MSYEWRERPDGDLHTQDNRVADVYHHILALEDEGFYGDGTWVFGLSLSRWDDKKDIPVGDFAIEFESERDYNEFKKVLAKALCIQIS